MRKTKRIVIEEVIPKRHLNTDFISTYLPFLTFILYSLSAVLVSIHRFWQFETFFYDFGIFDQAIWKASQFIEPTIEHLAIGGKNILADHFTPSMFLISPIYWFTDRPEALLIVQALSVSIAGLLLFYIGKKVLKNDALSYATMIAFYLFVGLQNAIITDFHMDTFMVLPLMCVFYAVAYRKMWMFIISFLITLGCKESTFLLGFGIAFHILVTVKEKMWRVMAIFFAFFSLVYGMFAIRVFIPHFSQGLYQYTPEFHRGVVANIKAFVDSPMKIRTFVVTQGSFSFLPVFAPSMWFLIFQDTLVRFVPVGTSGRWDIGMHYSAQIAVISAISTIYGLLFIQKVLKNDKRLLLLVSFMMIGISVFLHQVVLHGPLGLSYNKAFYENTKNFSFLESLVSKVPKNTTVMAQNNLAVRFTHHKEVWLLRNDYEFYKPDYVVIDVRDGQNPNDFMGGANIFEFLKTIKDDKKYKSIYETEKQYLFERVK